MLKNKINKIEYKKILKSNGSRKTRSVSSDNTKAKVLRQAISKVSRILPNRKDLLFPGSFSIETCIVGYRKGDVDNVGKGILDALQDIAYGNDRDCEDFRSYRNNH